jgi:putative transposase
MARMARVVAPGAPHHVTQRGNRRQPTFFGEEDYAVYRHLLAGGCKAAGVEVLAYCLMPNHVHLILVPQDEDGLRAALAETHRRYSRHINQRQGWRGYLWQGRFASVVMDEAHLLACARYVELNPVRAQLTARPQDWAWSSARAHLEGAADPLVGARPMLQRVPDWADFLGQRPSEAELKAIRAGERTGRPLGSAGFIARLEGELGRSLAKQKTGPKPRRSEDAAGGA